MGESKGEMCLTRRKKQKQGEQLKAWEWEEMYILQCQTIRHEAVHLWPYIINTDDLTI